MDQPQQRLTHSDWRLSRNLAAVDTNLKGEMAYVLIDQLHDQGIPVVVITGYAILPQVTGKVAAVLQKPFNGPELWPCAGRFRCELCRSGAPSQPQATTVA